VLEQVSEEALQPRGEHRSSAVDPNERNVVGVVVLVDLVRDSHERTAHVIPVEDDLLI